MTAAPILLSALLALTSTAPQRIPFDPKRDPQRDLWAAIDVARAEQKRILLDVGGEWCGWCHLLDRTIASDTVLSEFVASRFVLVKVNWSSENQNKAFLKCLPEIPGYPHLFVLDCNGVLIHSQRTDDLEGGGEYDWRHLLEFLQHWSE